MVVCGCPWLVQNVSLAKCTGPNIYWKFNGGVAVFSSNGFLTPVKIHTFVCPVTLLPANALNGYSIHISCP